MVKFISKSFKRLSKKIKHHHPIQQLKCIRTSLPLATQVLSSSNQSIPSSLFSSKNIFDNDKDKVIQWPKITLYDVTLHQFPDDGNSFYNCLSDFFTIRARNIVKYRTQIGELALENIKLIYNDKEEDCKKIEEAKSFAKGIFLNGTYAGFTEVFLASVLYEINIIILQRIKNEYFYLHSVSAHQNINAKLMMLQYDPQKKHYELLTPKNKCLKNEINQIILQQNTKINYNSKVNIYSNSHINKNVSININNNDCKSSNESTTINSKERLSYDILLPEIKQYLTLNIIPSRISIIKDKYYKKKKLKKFHQISNKFIMISNELFYQHKAGYCRIPDKTKQTFILSKLHLLSNHKGISILQKSIIENRWWWSGYTQDAKLYVQSCIICQNARESKLNSQ